MRIALALSLVTASLIGEGTTPPPLKSEITPSAGPVVTDWSDFKISVDGLWWIANQEGISFAQTGRGTGATNNYTGHDKNVDFSFQPGIRVGLGLDFRHDGWDLFANYTWLNPAEQFANSRPTESTGGMLSRWQVMTPSQEPFALPLLEGKEKWRMWFNILDTELGRNFSLSSKLSTRPFIGFKAAWIDQMIHVRYWATPGFDIDQVHLRMRQDFTGFGIRMGVNGFWLTGEQWGIFGNCAFSALWSSFDEKRRDRLMPTGGSEFTSYHVHESFHTLVPVIEMGLGLQYLHDFEDRRRRFTFQLGWEEQIWLDQNRFLNCVEERSGNLTLQGITGRIAFAW